MIYVILCSLAAVCLSTVFKYADRKGCDGNNITLVNYVTASLIPMFTALRGGLFSIFGHFGDIKLSTVFTEKSEGSTLFILLVFGITEGVLYLVTILLEKDCVIQNGTNICTFLKNISFIVTIQMAAVIWHELPGLMQYIALVLIIAGLALVIGNLKELKVNNIGTLLLIPLLVGIINVIMKVFSKHGIPDYEQLFMFMIYFVALISSYVNIRIEGKKANKKIKFTGSEILWGVVGGCSNIAYTFFSLKSMAVLPVYIYLPLQTGGSFLFAAILGKVLFNDNLTKKQLAAICLVIAGIAVMNI